MKIFYKSVLLVSILAIGSNANTMDVSQEQMENQAKVFLNALYKGNPDLRLIGATSIPKNISMKNKLNLCDSENLTMLPSEIKFLENLTFVNICSNKITTLPPEILQLKFLRKLDFSENQLSKLPPEIWNLTSLTNLNLSHNSLENIPGEINKLSVLTELDLSHNEFKDIPHGVSSLVNLSSLNLCHNKITGIPNEIGNLIKLEKLYILNNRENIQLPEFIKIPRSKIYVVHDLKINIVNNDPIQINFGNRENFEKLFVLSNPENTQSSEPTYVPRLEMCGVYVGQANLSFNKGGLWVACMNKEGVTVRTL